MLTLYSLGVQQNYTMDLSLNLDAYNISASLCLREPVYTSKNVYIIISLVLFAAGMLSFVAIGYRFFKFTGIYRHRDIIYLIFSRQPFKSMTSPVD